MRQEYYFQFWKNSSLICLDTKFPSGISCVLPDDLSWTSWMGFPGGSDGKESACNAGDLGSISGLGRCPGGGIGYPLQYSWTSLVAQLVKNPPAMWETWVWFLGWEDPLEQGMATHSSILAWRIPWTVYIHGVAKSWTQLSSFHTWTYRTCNALQC